MYTMVDERPPLALVDHRYINGKHRYYYVHQEMPDLLVVCFEYAIEMYLNRVAVVKFSSNEDSNLLCNDLPSAPQEWRGMTVRKATLMPVVEVIKGKIQPINEVLK